MRFTFNLYGFTALIFYFVLLAEYYEIASTIHKGRRRTDLL